MASFSLHTIIEDKAGPSLYRDRKFEVWIIAVLWIKLTLKIRDPKRSIDGLSAKLQLYISGIFLFSPLKNKFMPFARDVVP